MRGHLKRLPAPAALIVLAGLLVGLDIQVPVLRQAAGLTLLVLVPTVLLYRRLRLLGDQSAARALYALGLTLLGLMVVGLLLNTVLPDLGEDRPLQPRYIAEVAVLVDLALLVWPPRSRPAWTDVEAGMLRLVRARFELAQLLAGLALALSVMGAIRLNNDAGSGVAIAALVCGIAALVALFVTPAGSRGRDLRVLLLVSLGLLLATSLRGWTITGHDIQAEYLTFRLTDDTQHWEISRWRNAYNACLSLNILPSMISQATRLSGVVVFKVLAQLVFATVPVMTFLVARRFMARRLALVSAMLFLAFPTFYTDMPYLVRQEMAFFFVALLLLVASAPAPQRARLRLAPVFGLGVVFSHYSTTYVLILGLGLGMTALLAWRLLSRRRARRNPEVPRPAGIPRTLVVLNPLLVGGLIACSLVWAGPVTGTGGHAREVAVGAVRTLLGLDKSTPGSSTLSFVPFLGGHTSTRERLDEFVSQTMDARAQVPRQVLLVKNPGPAELKPDLVKAGAAPPTALGTWLDRLGLDPDVAVNGVRIGGALVMQGLLLVGLVSLLRRRRAGARAARDPDVRVPEETLFTVLGVTAALGVIVVIPTLSVDYGVLRAFQQTLLVAAPVVAVGSRVAVNRLRARTVLSWAVPVALFVAFSGLVPVLLGGHNGRLALGNNGLYYERYIAADSDISGLDWVQHADKQQLAPASVIANRNIDVRLLTEDPLANVADRLYPTLLSRGSYVFVDARLAETHRSAIFYTGDVINYRYPLHDLDQHMDVVYTAADTRIYR